MQNPVAHWSVLSPSHLRLILTAMRSLFPGTVRTPYLLAGLLRKFKIKRNGGRLWRGWASIYVTISLYWHSHSFDGVMSSPTRADVASARLNCGMVVLDMAWFSSSFLSRRSYSLQNHREVCCLIACKLRLALTISYRLARFQAVCNSLYNILFRVYKNSIFVIIDELLIFSSCSKHVC